MTGLSDTGGIRVRVSNTRPHDLILPPPKNPITSTDTRRLFSGRLRRSRHCHQSNFCCRRQCALSITYDDQRGAARFSTVTNNFCGRAVVHSSEYAVSRTFQNRRFREAGAIVGRVQELSNDELRQAVAINSSILQERHHSQESDVAETRLSVLRVVSLTIHNIRTRLLGDCGKLWLSCTGQACAYKLTFNTANAVILCNIYHDAGRTIALIYYTSARIWIHDLLHCIPGRAVLCTVVELIELKNWSFICQIE